MRAAATLVAALALASGCTDGEDVQAPIPVGGPEAAEYPLDLWDEGVEGETTLRLKIARSGAVDSVEVAESSGHDAFDSAAVRWGREARFSPAVRGVDTIEVWARVPVRFEREGRTGPGAAPDGGAVDGGAAADEVPAQAPPPEEP